MRIKHWLGNVSAKKIFNGLAICLAETSPEVRPSHCSMASDWLKKVQYDSIRHEVIG
jgi:hypothetical protein